MLTEPDVRTVPVFIYGLVDPRDLKLRYVGRSQNPKKRLGSHAARSGSIRTYHWIHTLRSAGLKPQIVTLAVVQPGEDATPRELAEIQKAASAGCDLLNYHGMPTKPRKLSTRRPCALIREAAALGHPYCQRRVRNDQSAAE